MAMQAETTPTVSSEATKPKQSAGEVPVKSKPKPKSKPKSKPPANTLDRWFKPARRSESSIAANGKPKTTKTTSEPTKIEKEKVAVKPKKSKAVGASKNFVQRYIHITDECRVCENAKTEEATRCELRCITCSMTVHKKCYGVKGELPEGDWNCRRCQFILDETSWEDMSSLVDGVPMKNAEDVVFPKHKSLDDTHTLHPLRQDCDFAAVFLFLQRFHRLGLKITNSVTLESLAHALMSPKEQPLCEELHTRLLNNVNATMSKKYTWSANLLRFLQDAEFPPAIAEDTAFPSAKTEGEERDAFYFDLPVKQRVAMLKFLCEIQFDRNDSLVELIDDEDAESMRNDSVGVDATDRSYFILEDAATVPDGVVWALVEELSLSVSTPDLQLWQALSVGVLKKLTRQLERRKRNARWQQELRSNMNDASPYDEGIGLRSLRTRRQVNYAGINTQEEEEEDDGEEEEEAFEANSSGDDVVSETDGEEEDYESENQRSTRDNERHAKKRKDREVASTHRSKQRRQSVGEDLSV
ncbi:hypothetical protein BBO99_00003080 [Phytophthora kernoviae]|uniref:Zinc finger PHD-type domain-containing protein n=2 Tax=Phytophthora kernoviae TaxID=325452 RepID=A0A421F5E9_9STRA|nr:hypothetical protein G195_009067 [Phytophthora kernoviae 00238/432]KAG2519797.1 hypothetical protein JM18_007133 [Phytophthora kernoviae]KAG2523233.1 hypothetical protein JM16_003856 [Phytophthora kernoviae]RLN25888.1 hypothetical protein BBI17_004133 [Phytophthora kernoviae]RLN82195.1 hypothetical protein BBO99_00003080 [Phytophthora kernoviae]